MAVVENVSTCTGGRRGAGIDSHKLLPVFLGAMGQLVLAFTADPPSTESPTGTRVGDQYLPVRTSYTNRRRWIVLLGIELLLPKWTSAMDPCTTVAGKAVFEAPTFHSCRAPHQRGSVFFVLLLGLEEATAFFNSDIHRTSQDRQLPSYLDRLELLRRFRVTC